MNSIRRLVTSIVGTDSSVSQSTSPDVRRTPSCESLEGRQLLSASGWAGVPHWGAITAPGTTDAAHVQPWSGGNDAGGHHFHGPSTDFQAKGAPGPAMPALSTQARTDMQTLSSDISKLQSEVPATLQDQIKADKATIKDALSSLTPQQLRAAFPAPSTKPTSSSDPTAMLTAELKAANVSGATINSIISDFKTYESTLKTVDPTLSAKIQADRAALAKDMPAPAGHPGPMSGASSLSVGHGLGI